MVEFVFMDAELADVASAQMGVLHEADTSTRKLVSSASDDKSEVVTVYQKSLTAVLIFFGNN